jgi:hypothetical protein
MACPENGSVIIKSLSKNNYKEITKIELLSKNQELRYQQTGRRFDRKFSQ